MIDLAHPANLGLVEYLRRGSAPTTVPEASPISVKDPYYSLGTHPDVVERLWDELGGALPKDCRWVLYGSPVLVRHATGIAFGFAGGSHTYSLRLPPAQHAAAVAAGAPLLTEIGPEWVKCRWFKDEDAWCRAAYEFAAPSAPGSRLPTRIQSWLN